MPLLEDCDSCIDNMLKLLLDRELGLHFIRPAFILSTSLQWHRHMETICIVD